MANVNSFNYELDKITERETVYDFVSRLNTGKDFINQDYNPSQNSNDKQIIFPAGSKLKDDVLMNIIRTLDTSHILNLDKLQTSYKKSNAGSLLAFIEIPKEATLYRIVQESTGYDVTSCFEEGIMNDNKSYMCIFDTRSTRDEIYKAYYTI